MTATKPTRRRTAKSPGQEAMGREHETLLLAAYHELPDLIATQLHSVGLINAALRDVADKRRNEVEDELSKLDLPADQIAILRAVPEIQFASTNLPRPKVILGRTLYRRCDARGDRKNVPEAICVLDFCVEVQVPSWSIGRLYLPSDPKKIHLKRPRDALSGLGSRTELLTLPGLVFTSDVTIGQAVHAIERVHEAARIDSVIHSEMRPIDPFVICVTNRPELAAILRDKVDVMWTNDIDEVHLDMRFLAKTVTVSNY